MTYDCFLEDSVTGSLPQAQTSGIRHDQSPLHTAASDFSFEPTEETKLNSTFAAFLVLYELSFLGYDL